MSQQVKTILKRAFGGKVQIGLPWLKGKASTVSFSRKASPKMARRYLRKLEKEEDATELHFCHLHREYPIQCSLESYTGRWMAEWQP